MTISQAHLYRRDRRALHDLTRYAIWHFCHVSTNARIGEYCILVVNVAIADGRRQQRQDTEQCSPCTPARLSRMTFFWDPLCVLTNVTNLTLPGEPSRRVRADTADPSRGHYQAIATIVWHHHWACHAFVAAGAVVTQDVRLCSSWAYPATSTAG